MINLSKYKKNKYKDGIERDEKGLTANDREILAAIDFEKIATDAILLNIRFSIFLVSTFRMFDDRTDGLPHDMG